MTFIEGQFWVLAALLIVLAPPCACDENGPASSDAVKNREIKLGIITDLSGPAAAIGQKVRIGAEIAALEIAGKGGKITLIFGDHGFDPKRAISEAQKLLTLDTVEALFVNFTPTSVSVAPLCKLKNVLLLYTAAARSPLEGNPQTFKSNLDYVSSCRSLVGYWRSRGYSKIGALIPEAEYGQLCLEGARQAKVELVVKDYRLGEPVDDQMLALKNAKVEALLNPAYERDLLNMFKALRLYQMRLPTGSDGGSATPALAAAYPGELEGMVVFGLPDLGPELKREVLKKDSSEAYLEHAGMGYLHVLQLWNALAACPRGETACQSENLAASGPDERVGFKRWKDRMAEYEPSLREFSNGRWNRLHAISG